MAFFPGPRLARSAVTATTHPTAPTYMASRLSPSRLVLVPPPPPPPPPLDIDIRTPPPGRRDFGRTRLFSHRPARPVPFLSVPSRAPLSQVTNQTSHDPG
ncbi:uncharacterized protein PSFLO_02109 [Pseudozyma flocculosa]|uniref:Uncharacterized protein n=1 Tax=Pseudozyma flocculosa TaxID=84751 RepID=A0A5C3EWN5_9BASI|nr:uncharacterized protein PSFLO_02109 [Pseudozyma flocculosa]